MSKSTRGLFSVEGLVESVNTCSALIDGKWIPNCPQTHMSTLLNRIKLAWIVFTGKGDVVIWPANQ